MAFQIIRNGIECWEIFAIDEIWGGTHEYEVIARVVKDGHLYYIELPQWKDKGKDFIRQQKGYQIPKGAFRAITESHGKPPVEKPKLKS